MTALDPCTLESVLDSMGTAGLDKIRPFIPSMGVECNDPSCKVSLNTNGILPGSPRIIRDLASPVYREIEVPGGVMVDLPAFHFLGQSGYALVNIGGSEGFLHASLRGPLRPPMPLNWLIIGLDMPDFENQVSDILPSAHSFSVSSLTIWCFARALHLPGQMDMVYSPAGMELAISSQISWGGSTIGANLTLVADPLPEFGLALFVNIPANQVHLASIKLRHAFTITRSMKLRRASQLTGSTSMTLLPERF